MKDPFAEREANRYAQPIPSREAIRLLLQEKARALSEKVIARQLGLEDRADCEALHKRLNAMLRDGQLLKSRQGRFSPVREADLVSGRIIANADGYGFLHPDDGGEDLYLSTYEMRRVLHGDRASARVTRVDRSGRRRGALVEVLEHRTQRLVGRAVVKGDVIIVVPDDSRISQDILITPDTSETSPGVSTDDIVVAELTSHPTTQHGPVGQIVSVLGKRLQPSLLVDMAVASHQLPQQWPEEVLDESRRVPTEIRPQDTRKRKDIRHLPLVTIDGADSRDFDDAVYVEPRRHGGFRLVVAIADVSHYVLPGSALDREAVNRTVSTYFPDYVIPMLPEVLSNGVCSLNPDVDRLCMVCDMSVNAEGRVTRSRFYRGVMRSHARLTYEQVGHALEGDRASMDASVAKWIPQLQRLHQVYQALAKARGARGALEFDRQETRFGLDAGGEVTFLGAVERNDAHRIIEECMIAANICAARFLTRKRIPALYRVHAEPPSGKYNDLHDFLAAYKLDLPPLDELVPADYNALLNRVRDWPQFEVIQSVLLRSMSMAVYLPTNKGHFGLALDNYAHFTSPIRRYPDLLVHRAIGHALDGGSVDNYLYSSDHMATLGTHCSHGERCSEEAEREVMERYRCAWMEKHVGETFTGIVSGVTAFGLFVDLLPTQVTGLVHVSQLPGDYYQFDPVRRQMQGERTRRRFCQGDKLQVKVIHASMEERKVDLALLEKTARQKKAKAAFKHKKKGLKKVHRKKGRKHRE